MLWTCHLLLHFPAFLAQISLPILSAFPPTTARVTPSPCLASLDQIVFAWKKIQISPLATSTARSPHPTACTQKCPLPVSEPGDQHQVWLEGAAVCACSLQFYLCVELIGQKLFYLSCACSAPAWNQWSAETTGHTRTPGAGGMPDTCW